MKVRLKNSRHSGRYDVIEESQNYYIVENDIEPGLIAVSKTHYELVNPEPHWQDVTEECGVNGSYRNQIVHHSSDGKTEPLNEITYRLRKVRLCERYAVGTAQTLDVAYKNQWAFVVERKAHD